jgi:hypothetical protein
MLNFSTDITALPARSQGAIREVLAASIAPMRLSISPCSRDLGRKRLSRHRRRYPTVEPGECRLSSFRIYLRPLAAAYVARLI